MINCMICQVNNININIDMGQKTQFTNIENNIMKGKLILCKRLKDNIDVQTESTDISKSETDFAYF